jgi:hypothetical protein
MKLLLALTALLSLSSFAQLEELKKLDVKTIKEKGCPIVNGKKDCTAEEVKGKLMDLKAKLKK